MGNRHPQAFYPLQLRLAFRIKLRHADLSLQECLDEGHMIREEMSIRADEAPNLIRRQHGLFSHQGEMGPDSQVRMPARHLSRLFHRASGGHQ